MDYAHVWFEPTTLSAVESVVGAAETTRPPVQILYSNIFYCLVLVSLSSDDLKIQNAATKIHFMVVVRVN